jgi:hypothetical protein
MSGAVDPCQCYATLVDCLLQSACSHNAAAAPLLLLLLLLLLLPLQS